MKLLSWIRCSVLGLALAALPACSGKSDSGSNKYGKWTLHATKYDDVNRAKAKENAADVLTQLQGDDKVCLVGLWAYNPPAILSAVKSAHREGKVHIVGFDEDEITLQGIKDGYIHATVVQQPFEFGYQSVRVMAALARDPKAALPKEVKDGIWNIPHLVIKKNNVEAFHAGLKAQKASGAEEGSAGEGKIKVGFVSNNEEEFWGIVQAGTRRAAREFDVEVLFRRPKRGTVDAQKEIIEDLLSGGVKAIAISVIDPKNQTDYLNKIADRVPLIAVDNDAPKSKRRCYIGTNNVAAGREVGKLVKEVLPDGGTIAIFVGQPDPINARERRQGVLDELADEGKTKK
jgi:ribose transport system substrate-binding protein